MKMRKYVLAAVAGIAALVSCAPRTVEISKEELLDKIKGGWAAQTIGVSYGQPTEFRYLGRVIPDSVALEWAPDQVAKFFNNDDIYMDLTFVGVMDRLGVDAPADSFAVAFANAGYPLWHANQSARYNILNGIMPPESGHWKYNPHANDIDFQIEADFAGLMCPGMPLSSAEIADRVGHLMNYGDGWYGGVFVAAMYANAFFSNDIVKVATDALKMIPEETHFHQAMSDVLACYRNDPADWKAAWQVCEDKWSHETGCPEGMFADFNIDALVNSAYLLIGLLYGEGDFGKTMEIATRCGQDSDCNPASAAGILGTMVGYDAIPEEYLSYLKPIEDSCLNFTPYSLNEVYAESFEQALEMVAKGGGKVDGENVVIRLQKPAPVRLEVSFEGLKVDKRDWFNCYYGNFQGASFTGRGLVLRGWLTGGAPDYVAKVRFLVDGEQAAVMDFPADYHSRSNDLFWNFDLEEKEHTVAMEWLNPVEGADLWVSDIVTYISE
ncbi:MAG: ADP-ribosylglycohydrolase family protein [Bacteroidales bacterium]|nr:ADP-ribosylglycohydrolase family protein [Bacteroidales bacterium]